MHILPPSLWIVEVNVLLYLDVWVFKSPAFFFTNRGERLHAHLADSQVMPGNAVVMCFVTVATSPSGFLVFLSGPPFRTFRYQFIIRFWPNA